MTLTVPPFEKSIRAALKIGSGCQIYSNFKKKWFNGEVAQIFTDEEGEWLEIRYDKSMSRQVQRYSAEMRPYVIHNPSEDYCSHDLYREKSQSLEWVLTLKNRDKIDLFDKLDKEWHIATVVHIEKIYKDDDEEQRKSIYISITYDCWQAKWNETLLIDPSIDIPRRLQKLHTKCPYHAYLNDDTLPPCQCEKITYDEQWWQNKMTCVYCGKKCCAKCYAADSDHCIECIDKIHQKDYNGILEAISTSISDNYFMDFWILHLITEYAMGLIVQCSNTIKKCTNDIFFESSYSLELNFKSRYRWYNKVKYFQYMPKFRREGTHKLCGKLRRIFCEDCTKNDLKWCKECGYCREAKPLNCDSDASISSLREVICHNRNYLKCTLCDELYCETAMFECEYCQKLRCKYCDLDCIRCPERINAVKAKEFNGIRDAVSNIVCSNYGYEISDCTEIVRVIAEYSMGVAVTCSNTIIKCYIDKSLSFLFQL